MGVTKTRTVVTINTIAQLIGRIASSGTTFLISLVIAQRLGPDGYGDFTKVTTYIAFFYLLVDLGLNTAYLQKEPEKQVTFQHLFGLRLIISFVAMFIAVSLLAFLPQGQHQGYTSLVRLGIILYAGSIFTQGLITTANVLFQKHLQYHRATVSVVLGSAVTLLFVWLFGGSSVVGTVLIFLIGSAVTALLAFFLLRPFITAYTPLFSGKQFKALLVTAIPLSLTLVFNVIYFRIDSVVLTLTQSTADVGFYNFAYKIFEFPLVLPVFLMNSLFPIFLTERQQEPQLFRRHAKQSLLLLLLLSVVVAVAVWLAAPLISTINTSFAPSIPILRTLCLGIPFFFLSAATMWILITLKKQRWLLLIYGLSMIGNIIASILFIPTYGVMAAAWITVINEAAVLGASAVAIHRL